MSSRERFWEYVDIQGPDDCWEWTRGKSSGYGRVGMGGRRVEYSHRYAFFLTHGRWPEGVVMHSCDNPPCCNPAHLSEGTHKENLQDMARKRRHGSCRVTRRGLVVIRQMLDAGHTYRSVGDYLGLSYGSVYSLMRER